ncbi:DUF3810 domain-containing protein [Bacteroidales bacterium OttesenSCG-928-I14]|nr:DUF3810 domain-containing protein [Bacteroidales bacterium OttesenSCG-928-I14]
MKKKHLLVTRYSICILLLIIVQISKALPSWGQVYASSVYPVISSSLSAFSSLFPFSLGDVFIALSIIGLIFWLLFGGFRRVGFRKRILPAVEYLLWVYIWFYLAWGLNYSQAGFYQRTGVQPVAYNQESFNSFLDNYIERLNDSYVPIKEMDKKYVQEIIIDEYKKADLNPGIHTLKVKPRVKTMLCSPLYSMVGVSGYMGPFFCEFNINNELPISQYPATYAHELSHSLGITNEAEANFYAYLVCSRSDCHIVRFCGYFSVMNYVLNNARSFVSEDEYKDIIDRINPEIINLANENRLHWQEKYSPVIGNIQNKIYNLYLKGNKISSGTKNYSEVVGLIISWVSYENIASCSNK